MLSRLLQSVPLQTRFAQLSRNVSCQGGDKKKIMDLKCKVALITGGESGIGAATACHLLSRGLKAVVIAGMNECKGEATVEKLNAAHGQGRSYFIKFNDLNIVAMKETLARFSSIDILFNNAGVMDDKNWEKAIDVNLGGVIRGTLLGLEYMPTSESGSHGIIINSASIFAFDSFPSLPVYVSASHAITGFSKAIGRSSKKNIRIVTLCPGVTATAMTENVGPQLTPEMTAKASEGLKALPVQSADAPGKAVAYLSEYAQSGTVWPVESNILFEVSEPDRKTFQNKVTDL